MNAIGLLPQTSFCRMQVVGKNLTLHYEGRQHCLKLTNSLKKLLALLSHPGMPITYLMLDTSPNAVEAKYRQFADHVQLEENGLHTQESFLRIPMVDLKTVKAVKQRLLQIISQQAEREENCDLAPLEDLQTEQEQLVAYLKEVYRPQGISKGFCDEGALLHKRVQKGLLRALAQIHEVEPHLARQIKASLKYHQTIVFHPQQLQIEILGFI